jgi:hypothetical protein
VDEEPGSPDKSVCIHCYAHSIHPSEGQTVYFFPSHSSPAVPMVRSCLDAQLWPNSLCWPSMSVAKLTLSPCAAVLFSDHAFCSQNHTKMW